MRQVKKNAYVNFSAEQMFFLVDDIKSYPEFLPWCTKTIIHERTESSVRATIILSKSGVSSKFTTCNTMISSQKIDLLLEDGPFSYFKGGWNFLDLGDQGSKVEFNLKFKFKNSLLDTTLGSFFESICDEQVNAFVHRAGKIYGHSE